MLGLATNEMILLASAVIGGCTLLYSGLSNRFQNSRQRRDKAAEIFQSMYSVKFYRDINHPVFCLLVKLDADSDEAREARWDDIVFGWANSNEENAPALNALYNASDNKVSEHYCTRDSKEKISEHQALVVFLQFWQTLDYLIDANLVDKKLSRQFFKRSFNYYAGFLLELSERVTKRFGQVNQPAWAASIKRLNEVLNR
ncbi:MAG: hypothetical protein AAF296_01805 [Pseudomonadota bacterium]